MFEYDEQKALRSEASSRITEPGAYVGTIMQCEHVKAQNSAAEFVRIMFRTDDGIDTWLSIFTKKKDGTEAFGVGFIMAMMGILKVQRMSAVNAKCRAWNGSVVDGQRYREIEGKKIGVVLGMRDRQYTDSNGFERTAYDPQVERIFDPYTRKTLTETRRNEEPKMVDRAVAAQIEAFKKLKEKVESARTEAFESSPRSAQADAVDTLSDDCPF